MNLLVMFRRASDLVVADDADSLILGFGDGAYEQARTRAREERLGHVVEGNRPRGHWDRVRREILKRRATSTLAGFEP
jgi:hypothetical protein